MLALILFGSVLGACNWNIPDDLCAILWEHDDCTGEKKRLFRGKENRMGGWNDITSSIEVHSRCELRVFEHPYHGGADHRFGGPNAYTKMRHFSFLRSSGWLWWKKITIHSWNDRISSWKCKCWWMVINAVPSAWRMPSLWLNKLKII